MIAAFSPSSFELACALSALDAAVTIDSFVLAGVLFSTDGEVGMFGVLDGAPPP
ncbi:hypothetical protein PC128_g16685 [Phytophthora cactorum]|nr:hypothetical protein PC128_g16685 [Phytophthora cactorum]